MMKMENDLEKSKHLVPTESPPRAKTGPVLAFECLAVCIVAP